METEEDVIGKTKSPSVLIFETFICEICGCFLPRSKIEYFESGEAYEVYYKGSWVLLCKECTNKLEESQEITDLDIVEFGAG